MALVKTNYGLIYNDDGSLCVTIRKDDVPFPGVTSFAVEEGTTNLFTNPTFQNGESGFDYIWGWSSRTIKDGGPLGRYIELVDSNPEAGNYYGHTFNVTPGQTYTFSVYINVLECQGGEVVLYYHCLDANGNVISAATSFLIGEEVPSNFIGQGWRRYKITVTAPANAAKVRAFVYSYIRATSRIQVTGFQFEEKPFATSFVDGMRADGQLRIENVLRNRDSWVVSFWYKHPGDFSVTRMLFGSPENDIVDPNEFSVFVTSTGTIKILNRVNNTTIFSIESSASIPANEWIFLTFIYTGSEIRAYMNRNQILSGTATINWNFTAGDPSKLWIGSVRTGNLSRTGGLFANLLIARYDPAIWTDEYIRTIYQTKRPFAVPPKLPIV
jgi:hypothetical protein